MRTWLIDPLRATLNYAVRMRVVAVNVALRVTGRVAAAAVVDSFNDEIFWTNSVSALLHANDEDTPLAPTGKSTLVDLNFDHPYLNAPAFKALMLAADMDFATRFKHRVVSTSLALVWVASGQRTAYVTNGDLRDSLHFTAGLAICELAGCIVIVLMGNSWGSGETGFLAAVDCRPHAALLDLIR